MPRDNNDFEEDEITKVTPYETLAQTAKEWREKLKRERLSYAQASDSASEVH